MSLVICDNCLWGLSVDPLNWPSFIEIGEIHVAHSTPAWCTQNNSLLQHRLEVLREMYCSQV